MRAVSVLVACGLMLSVSACAIPIDPSAFQYAGGGYGGGYSGSYVGNSYGSSGYGSPDYGRQSSYGSRHHDGYGDSRRHHGYR